MKSMERKILIAEDDEDIVELLTLYLESAGYEVFTAGNGIEALAIFEKEKIDMAVLDIMMPMMDGYALTRKIRERASIPILILSAKSEDEDKILGLNLGADDYLAKPFNPLEIVARVNANMRRISQTENETGSRAKREIRVGDLVLNLDKVSLRKGQEEIELTATEFKILAILMENPGQVFTKMQIYERINGAYYETDDNTMMVHISKLRDKVEENSRNPRYIKTVRGVGYKIEDI